MVLATLDVCSLYTNIPQEEGIDVVCRYYEDHYEQKLPIPTSDLRELMRLILEENSFKFNEKHFVQTHGVAMGTKMAVAFSVIFMADLEKRLLAASPLKPLVWKRFIDDIFPCGTFQGRKFPFLLTSLSRSTLRSSLLVKCHPNALFFSIQRYSKDLAFHLLESSIHKPILSH